MKKILVIVSHFYPHVGGVEKYVEELFSRIASLPEYEIHVLTVNDEGPREENFKELHIHRVGKLFSIGSIFMVPKFFEWNKAVDALCIEHSFSMINTHTRFFLTSYLGAKFAKKKYIFHLHTEHGASSVVHGSIVIRLGSWFFDHTLGTYVMKNADQVIAISKAGVKFCKELGAKKVVYIPNGIDGSFWKPEKKESQSIKNILFVGRITQAKGVGLLIEAIQKLTIPCQLTVIGDGEYLEEMKQQAAQLPKEIIVKFLGSQSTDQVKAELNKADCFVNPSLNEGLPTTVLEALSSGVPTVATDAGGTKDILALVPEYSTLVPVSDILELTKALSKTLALNLTTAERSDCHQKIGAEFDWGVIVQKINTYIV